MTWTTPTTRATGDLITSSIWNTDLVNNIQFLHATALKLTSSPSIFNAALGVVANLAMSGATVLVDNEGRWNDGASVYVPNVAGYYWVTYTWRATSVTTSGSVIDIVISQNGANSGDGAQRAIPAAAQGVNLTGTGLIFANGTTDQIGIMGGTTGPSLTGLIILSITPI